MARATWRNPILENSNKKNQEPSYLKLKGVPIYPAVGSRAGAQFVRLEGQVDDHLPAQLTLM